MRLTKAVLTGLGVTSERADKYLAALNEALAAHAIDTPLRVAHFLAQVLHESGKMRWVEENLNYSADGLRAVFSKYFNDAEAREYARNPERIANRTYGNRMGNGDEASGDGYRYRGRGLIQLTGKDNYRAFSDWIHDDDVVSNPDLVADKYAVHSAVYYWSENNINRIADRDDVRGVTKAINGGLKGLDDRMELLQKAKQLIDEESRKQTPEAIYTVIPRELNLRREPRVATSTWMAALPQGAQVTMIGDAAVNGWSQIRATVNGQTMEGFVASRYLQALSQTADADA